MTSSNWHRSGSSPGWSYEELAKTPWLDLSAVAHPERLPEFLQLLSIHCSSPTEGLPAHQARGELCPLCIAWNALGIDPEKLKETT